MPADARGTHRAAGLAAAAALLVADQLAKWAVLGPLALPERGAVELLPVFRLLWVENRGVSGGLLASGGEAARWLLTLLTAAIAAGVAAWLWRERALPEAVALGAVLGGALGNIADRVRYGHVVDFLNLHFGGWSPFLVFNVADAGISLGVALLVVRALVPRGGG